MKVKHLNVTFIWYFSHKILSFLQNTNKEKYRKRSEQKLDNLKKLTITVQWFLK